MAPRWGSARNSSERRQSTAPRGAIPRLRERGLTSGRAMGAFPEPGQRRGVHGMSLRLQRGDDLLPAPPTEPGGVDQDVGRHSDLLSSAANSGLGGQHDSRMDECHRDRRHDEARVTIGGAQSGASSTKNAGTPASTEGMRDTRTTVMAAELARHAARTATRVMTPRTPPRMRTSAGGASSERSPVRWRRRRAPADRRSLGLPYARGDGGAPVVGRSRSVGRLRGHPRRFLLREPSMGETVRKRPPRGHQCNFGTDA